ncbi:Ig-like domain-containing protein [Chryseobacterium cheonjiense]|uniref:Ig-like domain-containing protein n=1 Tax=Chryseobacterium cheonjiense TaxID=2728845 RepID=A0A7Y0A8E2_9FLAO|nr:Ig-like domain-containing protein [Chryseobacterium cheonjiense]NML58559.1 Ig-like domain-containing protein [Chryseobacterium cheonjiense]
MKRLLVLFVIGFLLQSCARVGSPVGGPKDTLAPKFLGSNIDSARINVPRDIKELRLDFDEYVTLKDINKNLSISPPIKNITRIIPSSIANKFVLIQWKDTLQANTTYNFNFGNAISDNNENNILRYFNFAFSTGEKLDDLYISGEIKDALSLKKASENKFVVGLYPVKDTIDYKQKPYYITKVDDDGYYELNYLAPGKYRIIAFEDENGNSIYDPGKEKVGFQKEPVVVEKSISGLNVKLYPSKKPVKYLETKEVPGGVLMTFEGRPDSVRVQSQNEKLTDYKVTHAPKSDSVRIWFDAVKSNLGQTTVENVKFGYNAGVKKDTLYNASLFYRYNTKNAMDVNSDNGGGMLAPKENFKISSNYYINKLSTDKWIFRAAGDSLNTLPFTARISETNPYQIIVNADFVSGKKYQLTVPKETVSSFYAKNYQSKRFDFEVDKVENYGSLTFKLENAPTSSYWIQLVDSSEKVLYQKYTKGNDVKFDILKPAEYIVRILVDNNENKYWDEADFQNDIFAEDSYIYYKTVIVRPLWDSNEKWDLKDTRVLDTSKLDTPKPNNSTAPTPSSNSVTPNTGARPELKSDRTLIKPTR